MYKGANDVSLEVKTDGETVWLTQSQMCQLFGRERTVITKHINNVFSEGELPREGFVQILHKTSPEGGRPVAYYWATRILREMLLNRLDEVKRIGAIERRLDSVEVDVKQLKGGMNYLVQQLSEPPPEPPRRRIGFGADDKPADKPYAKGC